MTKSKFLGWVNYSFKSVTPTPILILI